MRSPRLPRARRAFYVLCGVIIVAAVLTVIWGDRATAILASRIGLTAAFALFVVGLLKT